MYYYDFISCHYLPFGFAAARAKSPRNISFIIFSAYYAFSLGNYKTDGGTVRINPFLYITRCMQNI